MLSLAFPISMLQFLVFFVETAVTWLQNVGNLITIKDSMFYLKKYYLNQKNGKNLFAIQTENK